MHSRGFSRTHLILLGLVLLAPRAFRMAWPLLWVEDPEYLHAGLLVAHGRLPYRDFLCPHFPFLEWLLGLAYLIAGPSLRCAEFLTQAAMMGTGMGLFLLGKRNGSSASGILAAALYGCSSLLFRYHLFQREVFTNLCLVFLCLSVLPPKDARPSERMVLPILLAIAGLLIKLTFIWEVLAVAFFLVLRKRHREALVFGLGTGVLLMAAAVAAFTLWGMDFIDQVFLVHLAKGRLGGAWQNLFLLMASVSVAGAWGVAGLIPMVGGSIRKRKISDGDLLMGMGLVFQMLFFLFLSPTVWPHNAVPALLFLTYFSGRGLDWVLEAGGRSKWVRGGAILFPALGLSFLFVFSEASPRWYFRVSGHVTRVEIERVAREVRENSERGDTVIVPAPIGVAANRPSLIHYRELEGIRRAVEGFRTQGEIGELIRTWGRRDFYEVRREAARLLGRDLTEAGQTGTARVVVPDDKVFDFSDANIKQEALLEWGYRSILTTDHYTVWVSPRSGRTAPAR